MELITPEQKDAVLKLLCASPSLESVYEFNKPAWLIELKMSSDVLKAILTDFHKQGLIENLNYRPNCFFASVTMQANDLLRRGGFVIVEHALLAELEKLLIEVETLKKETPPDKLGRLEKISTILNTVVTVAGQMLS